MAWQCLDCARFWGSSHRCCPLCTLRLAMRMALRRRIADVAARMTILQFVGSRSTVQPLPSGTSLCYWGTPRCCRCTRCRGPPGDSDPRALRRLARKYGHGRARAARWMHLLSGLVSRHPAHGVLHGLLLTAGCGRGPHVRFLQSRLPELVPNAIKPWVRGWMTALFLPYVRERCDLRSLLGTASFVLLRINIT